MSEILGDHCTGAQFVPQTAHRPLHDRNTKSFSLSVLLAAEVTGVMVAAHSRTDTLWQRLINRNKGVGQMKPVALRFALGLVFVLFAGPAWSSDDGLRDAPERITPDASSPLTETPAMNDFETLNFRGAAACSPCHSAGSSSSGGGGGPSAPPVMVDQWSVSIMAYGSLDPFWQAKVRSEVLRAPADLRALVEGKCAACHTPMAATEAKLAGEPVLLFDGGFLDPAHQLHDAAMESIGCTLCHRIENSGTLGTDDGFSGNYTIEPVDAPENRPHYGPYADTFDQPMISSVGLDNDLGVQIDDPALCATCHNLKTPFLDDQGNIVGTDFPEQMPFSEWLHSGFAALEGPVGCQQCHMEIEDEGRLAQRPRWLDERARASHAFLSANTEILSLLAMETALQGGDPAPLLASADAGREFLTHAGELEILDAALDQGVLEFTLRVGNTTGHKLPTAFPSRRVFLHAVVRDAGDNVVFESGAMTADGRIVGVDSDDDPTAFEPHYESISSPDQVQVYEAILGTTDDDVTWTLLRAGTYLKDNRIVPAGFDPAEVPDDVRPAGGCMQDPDFGSGRDEITYRISDLRGSFYAVTVELRHQAIGYPYVDDLREYAADPVVGRFLYLYDAVRPGSEVIAEVGIDVGG